MSSSAYRTRDEAAAKIQAGFRGYKTRKECKTTLGTGQRSTEDQYHLYQPTPLRAERVDLATKRMDPDVAATRIQATFRGYETRKHFHLSDFPKARPEYSTRIDTLLSTRCRVSDAPQTDRLAAGYGGALGKEFPYMPGHTKAVGPIDPNRAATRIQASFRGYQTRKALSEENAPTLASSRFVHHQKARSSPRKNHTSRNRADQAAAVIQAGVRGYLTRKAYSQQLHETPRFSRVKQTSTAAAYCTTNKENDPDRAATKIQAIYRGYRTRKHSGYSHPSV